MSSPASPPLTAGPQSGILGFSAIPRRLVPGLTDVLFLGILLWTVVLAPTGWGRLLWDGDTGLHIRIGDFIVQNHYVPTTDPFSFTRQGTHWLATEWLTGVTFSLLNTYVGLKGVVFLCGVSIAATLIIVLRTCLLTGGNAFIAVVAVLMTANASSFHFHARPHVFTWVFLAISTQLLAVDTLRPTRLVWLLVPLAMIWANLHGGYAILFALLGIFLFGAFLEGGFRDSRVRRYALLIAACGAASLFNAFGYRLHLETLAYLRNKSILNTMVEFQAPNFRNEPQMYFMMLLFVALAVAGVQIAKRRYTQALLIVAFSYLALTSVRHIPIFAIVVVPILVGELTVHYDVWARRQSRKSTSAILHDVSTTLNAQMRAIGLWSFAGLAALYFLPAASSWPQDYSNDRFPVDIARRHSLELAESRLFTTDQWADYLMFKNPAQRVFLDDRAGYSEQIISDALTMMDAGPGWRQALEKYRIDAVLSPAGTPLASELSEDHRWKLIDSDEGHVLFKAEAR